MALWAEDASVTRLFLPPLWRHLNEDPRRLVQSLDQSIELQGFYRCQGFRSPYATQAALKAAWKTAGASAGAWAWTELGRFWLA